MKALIVLGHIAAPGSLAGVRNRFVNYRTKRSGLYQQCYSTFPISSRNVAVLAVSPSNATLIDALGYSFSNNGAIRCISTSVVHFDQPSSKVEVTVQTIKKSKKEQEQQQTVEAVATTSTTTDTTTTSATKAATAAPPTQVVATAPVKKTLQQRIWAEVLHYYHGFRLLFIDINVSRKLIWRVLNGKTLTRREHRLLVRTTSDMFRLLPFSVFIIVPFMELLLPLAIKLFPGMLPSTFQTATEQEDKIKQNLKVKLEMAKFLQKTLDDMTVQNKEHRSQAAKDFSEFFAKSRTSDEFTVTNEDIIKYSKLFEDEITLDSLSRPQLQALCRVLEMSPIGTSNLLRFQLRLKLRSLAADDRTIQKEGIESLNLSELQAACRARGMRAYGATEERLQSQLREWINLSLNEKVPPSLLLLSRALMLPENVTTSDKLKATISALPDSVATVTKAAIGEREGKIDNKTKIEVIKEEQRRIKEELEEEKEKQKEIAETLVDKAPIIAEEKVIHLEEPAVLVKPVADKPVILATEEISSKDLEALGDALGTLSKDKKTLLVEKEEIKDLKEEIADYQEDVQELQEVITAAPGEVKVKESRAAKMLYKHVNSMISKMDTVLADLEKKEQELKEQVSAAEESASKDEAPASIASEELVRIDELMSAIRKIQQIPDDSRLDQISKILGKIDDDHDGHIKVEDVLKVIETIGKENVKLNAKQVDELIDLLDKEEVLEAEDKIEKALSKSLEAKEKQKEQESKEKEKLIELQDKAIDLSLKTTPVEGQASKGNETKLGEPILDTYIQQKAAERKKEQIKTTASISSDIDSKPPVSGNGTANIPPTIVPPAASSSPTQDKRM
ncbi:mitochondrial proton/calcium exchanger protein isoform X2 [Topomyia yanbarensis]|uniref:mitochondrial proton/calcium exchanger protein isoform X2 n=1 Tax=Topomyia yanbarensis TaxID=2498891 RepID=UPI00273B98C1|nr:mitochondrial proton/calcium exchanger protein isoform X2 [Topomyia yanbarensis]